MLTFSRIALTIALIFIYPPMGVASFIVYCIAGSTDMIDGPLARRIPGGKSKLGAELDSIADMFLIIVGTFVLMPAMEIWSWLWFAVIAAVSLRIVLASITGLIKHKKVLFNHTIANKITALLLFTGPILYFIIGMHIVVNLFVVFLIVWAFMGIFEEGLINLLLKEPNTNIKGVWKVKEENEKIADS